ncbi:MAG: tetratricopeptide repeat protein [Prolixibacteraceae bacterium]|nr:tetratricopeptide repeat protein [Prolixibacteraceae bacterium]
MNKRKKLALFISIAVVALVVLFLVTKSVINTSYQKQIPELPDFSSLSGPVKEQLSLAHEKAYKSPTSENIGELGMAYHSSAFYDQAKQCYKLATKKDQSKWIWNYYLGYLNQEMGDSKAAIEDFNAVLKENPDAKMVWYYLGKAYRNTGAGDLAETAFNKIANLPEDKLQGKSIRYSYSPLWIGAKFELARTYLNTNRVDEAEKLLKDVVKENQSIGPVYRLLGNVYSAKGDSVLSKKYIVRAKDLAEGTTINDTLIDRITLLSRSELYLPKQIDEANKSNNPEWASILFDHALLYLTDNKHIITKAVKFFLQMNKAEKSLPFLNENLTYFKDDFNEMSEIASLLYIKGYYSEAIPYYVQAKRLRPESFDLVKDFAVCYWKANKKDSALNLMNELHEKYRNNPTILAIEVDFMLKIGDRENAKAYLAKLRQASPSNPKVPKFSGIIAEMEGNRNAAIPMYEAALKSDPTDLDMSKKLGTFYIEQRKWSEAMSLLKKSVEYHPNESFLMEMLGTLLISCPDPNLQNIPEGLEFSERAYFHISSAPKTLLAVSKNLALGYAMTGNVEAATSYIQIALNIARSEKVSQDYFNGLLRLQSGIMQAGAK